MITVILISGSTIVGMFLGFWLCDLKVFMTERAGASPAPTRPEALAAEPREIVAVYEARLEMKRRGESCIHPFRQGDHKDTPLRGGEAEDDETVMVDYFPMSRKALKGWEKEQDKREKRRVR